MRGFIKLDSNENQKRHFINIADIIKEVDPKMYPDVEARGLKKKISEKFDIDYNEVFASNGSDYLIKVITFTLVKNDEEILMPSIAFPTYQSAAKVKGCNYKLIPLKNHKIDLEETLHAITDKTRLIWLSNPHNPTGTFISEEVVRSFLNKVPKHIVVVLDEAYIEYLVSKTERIDSRGIYRDYENVIILRTLSKAYGLAGARVGYGFARKHILDKMALMIGPFDLNSYAQALGECVLDEERYLNNVVSENRESMIYMVDSLKELGFEYIESYTSFIMFKTGKVTDSLCDYMGKRNVCIKNGKQIGMPEWVRISLGTREQMKLVVSILKDFSCV